MEHPTPVLKFENDENLELFYVEKATNELRETHKIREDALEEFKKLILDNNNIDIPLDDEDINLYLMSFLRICKFYTNSALERIRCFCHCRVKYPNYFAHILPINEKNPFQQNLLTIVPQRDQQGRRILILHLGKKWKPNKCSLAEIIRGIVLIIELAMLEPRTQVSGVILIVDVEEMNLEHAWQFSPRIAKMLLEWVQDSMPLRLKDVHVVRQSKIFNVVFALFKPFLREKLKNRIHLHGYNKASLLANLESKYIPTYYGGDLDISLEQDLSQWSVINSYSQIFERNSKYGNRQNIKK